MQRLAAVALAGFLLAVAIAWGAPVRAGEPFPTRPLTLVVPFPPGGATDIVGRLLAARVEVDLGQPVVVENRSGGAGNIGTLAVARSAPDGYTMVLATTTQLINQFLLPNIQYDIFTDLAPVALVADAPELLAISAKMQVGTAAEFVAAARASAEGLNFGSAGIGSVPHLGGELLARSLKVRMVHVPFRGIAEAMRELAAGNIQFSFATQASVASFVGSGSVKILAVAAPKRLSTLRDVPTAAQAGIANLELSNWFGIMMPKGTSAELVARLNGSFNKALEDPETSKRILTQGIEPVLQAPEYFAARLREDAASYKKIIDQIGLAAR